VIKVYEINIISDDHFRDLVAEVIFPEKLLSAIVSQERSRAQFEISLYSHIENSKERFYRTEKIDGLMIDFEVFLAAIVEAKERLTLLDVARD
jgi:hypothetical protein